MSAPQVIVRHRKDGAWTAYHLGFMPGPHPAELTQVVLGWDGPRAVILDLQGVTQEWLYRLQAALIEAGRNAEAQQEQASA